MILPEPGPPMTLAEVLRESRRFTPPATPASNLGTRPDAVWVRIPLQVHSGDGHWILNIDHPSLHQIDAYLVGEDEAVKTWRMGATLSFTERPLAVRSHAIPLSLLPGKPYVLYLRVRTETSMLLPMALVKPGVFYAAEFQRQVVQGLLTGLSLALMAYSLVNWRSPLFGLFALRLACSTTFFLAFWGLLQQHLWHDQLASALGMKLAPLVVLLGIVASGRFIQLSMDSARHSPRLHAAINAILGVAVVVLVASVTGVLGYRGTQIAPTVLGPTLMLLALPVALGTARRGDTVGRTMMVAWTAYLLGACSIAGLVRGFIPANVWTMHLFQVALVLEMLAWLRVLSLNADSLRRTAERAEVERRTLHRLAHTDALTGLLNRRGLSEALARALCQGFSHRERPHGVAVYLLDLDGFKPVNDRLGHEAGDELLTLVAERLKRTVRQSDVVARLGGDEFVIVAGSLGGDAETEAQGIGHKLLEAFLEPFPVKGQSCRVGLTIGFSLSPHDGHDADELLKLADMAMYAGKQAGRHTLRRGQTSPVGSPDSAPTVTRTG
ncbi:diguanylate cyclase [Ideonella livida]|uniref:GGDEF domain-containing protein n=1 Tax=Ideonella livida TaxID=2707176 RepID=A0A7C9TK39_9BURK|nr:diguanylate cyclase [Ideonella livida]NDY92460.1 GGDEF domain-containing protein [Ideonella livida]